MSKSVPRESDQRISTEDSQTDGDHTPTATQQHLPLGTTTNTHETKDISTVRPTLISTPSYATDAASSTIVPSTYAPSTLNDYAPSTADTNTSLLNGQYPRSRFASEPVPLHKKTKGRKAFVGLCDAINLVVPLDINHQATSMSQSSFVRTKHAVQDWTQKRRSVDAGRGNNVHGQAQ